jgi:hypothetical protein
MGLESVIAVTGTSSLYTVVSSRKDGVIAAEIGTGKRVMLPSRNHQFSQLAAIQIYADIAQETVPLFSVFTEMLAKEEAGVLVPSHKEKEDTMRAYFEMVCPEHDRQRVYPSDIKKVLRWYKQLKDAGMLSMEALNKFSQQTEETSE